MLEKLGARSGSQTKCELAVAISRLLLQKDFRGWLPATGRLCGWWCTALLHRPREPQLPKDGSWSGSCAGVGRASQGSQLAGTGQV